MEIEAKFTISDPTTLHQLHKLDHLGNYIISPGIVKQVKDSYLDTPARDLLAAGYALRRRESGGQSVMALKGLGGVDGVVHRREELEVALPPTPEARQIWLGSQLYARLFQITGEDVLSLLFALTQQRTVSRISLDGRPVAELSLDEASYLIDGHTETCYELEIELAETGTEADLDTLINNLQTEWNLDPQPLSKFERGLALLDGPIKPETPETPAISEPELAEPDAAEEPATVAEPEMPKASAKPKKSPKPKAPSKPAPDEPEPASEITGAERAILTRIADTEKDLYSRRAIALLALAKNPSTKEAGEIAGLSARQVRHWRNAFQEKRERIFPKKILTRATTAPKLSQLRLDPDDSMAEAARKILQFQLQRMIFHEPGTRLGKNMDELHDMRVATRRMRAALRVFSKYLDRNALRPFESGLQEIGGVLGGVRDLDVFGENIRQFADDQSVDLLPLQKSLKHPRKDSRQALIAHFDSDSYQKFRTEFAEFLREPGVCALPTADRNPHKSYPHRLRHVIPVILYQRWAAIRAYDELVTQPDIPLETLHRLRIDCKRLRYTLEFFQSALGPNAQKAIEVLKGIQDHLGALQDTMVAEALILDFLTQEGKTTSDVPAGTSDAKIYLAARQSEQATLLGTFPQAWETFLNAGINQWLAAIARRL